MSSGPHMSRPSNEGASTSQSGLDVRPVAAPLPSTSAGGSMAKTETSHTAGNGAQEATVGGSGEEEDEEGTDLISTIESDLTLLVQIMSSSIHYISNRSAHVQLNQDVPLYHPTGAGQVMASKFLVDEASMMDSIEELTDDLVGKVKDIEKLVEQLPQEREEAKVKEEMSRLQGQMKGVNDDYREALNGAASLKTELDALLQNLCDDYQATRARLADSATKSK